jgi:tetratricopeptide (TPR) repeat protein
VARQLFDDDPRTAFAEGWQAEALASPLVQEGVRTAVVRLEKESAERALAARKRGERDADARGRGICELVGCTSGRPFGIKNERLNLLDAEKHYSEAVKRDPQFTEAHVRLARVRSLLGKHAEAESILQRLPDTEDKTVMFYARLFLGAAQEALGKLDDAATAYTSALALFPGSQSAHLAMSSLAQRRGDDSAAQAHAQKALASTNANGDPDDPFQSYSMGLGRQADALWSAWYAGARAQQ